MVTALESVLRSMPANFVTIAITLAIMAFFTIAVFFHSKGKHEGFTNYVPVLLTSIGILGTFLGISIGLVNFDPHNIDNSISELLAGMKTAFFTSLAGMGFSIIFKFVQQFMRRPQEMAAPEEFDAADIIIGINKQQECLSGLLIALGGDGDTSILSQMKLLRGDINDNSKSTLKLQQDTSAAIQSMNNMLTEQTSLLTEHTKLLAALGGEEDTSILGQMKLLRSDINDNNKAALKLQQDASTAIQNVDSQFAAQKEAFEAFSGKLWDKLQDFADIMSKSATEAIIDALRQVIVDFNQNLTEQFGENFKELNSAVTDLVTWQENYKEQIAQMTEQYKLGVTAITATEAAVGKISEDTQSIPPAMDNLSSIMNDLSEIMEVNQQQLSGLAQHLAAFEEMKDKAVEAVPTINEHIDNTIKAIKASVESTNEHYNNLLEETGELQDTIAENIESMQKRLEATLEEVYTTNTQNTQKVFANIEAGLKTQIEENGLLHEILTENIENMQKRLGTTLEEIYTANMQNTQKLFVNIEEGLKTQVERTEEIVNAQLNLIDQSMQQELNRVIGTMGEALGRISNQFVNDYSRLVDQMNNVVSARRN